VIVVWQSGSAVFIYSAIYPLWQPAFTRITSVVMDTTDAIRRDSSRVPHSETETERQRRPARETDARDRAWTEWRRRVTLEGLADVDAGRLIDDEAMQAWADSLGTEEEWLLPRSD